MVAANCLFIPLLCSFAFGQYLFCGCAKLGNRSQGHQWHDCLTCPGSRLSRPDDGTILDFVFWHSHQNICRHLCQQDQHCFFFWEQGLFSVPFYGTSHSHALEVTGISVILHKHLCVPRLQYVLLGCREQFLLFVVAANFTRN